ncbi:MAG TPA: hypothetical protein PLG09_08555 [Syntrophomonadaceae bacterium]|nr:hypothetical protein [Syntrophomonadaceae bacterium]HPU49279.1 hypothetical protein [Syntrophomonadaceae bacterium]
MVREFPGNCCPGPPCVCTTQVSKKIEKQLKIEIDDSKCCCIPKCPCENEELVRNGGFEMISADPTQPFADWRAVNALSNTIVSRVPENMLPVAYEGIHSAWFITEPSPVVEQHSISLQQNVTVTPGCIYRLSFAENLLIKGNGMAAAIPILTAKVIYIDNYGNAVDLIVVPILKFDQNRDPDRGYVYHEATADVPVPCGVSELIVRFEYFENSSIGSAWLLDSVSLRAVFPTSACCQCPKEC